MELLQLLAEECVDRWSTVGSSARARFLLTVLGRVPALAARLAAIPNLPAVWSCAAAWARTGQERRRKRKPVGGAKGSVGHVQY